MITLADVASGKFKECIRHLPATQNTIKGIVSTLQKETDVSSQLMVRNGETVVRVRVKIHREHTRFMVGDVENPRWLLNSLFYLDNHAWEYSWDPYVSHEDKCAATREAITDLIFEDESAKAALEAIAAKVTKLIRLRSKTMPEKSRRARAAYVEDVLRDVRHKLESIRDDIDEETVVLLWREILVEGTHES